MFTTDMSRGDFSRNVIRPAAFGPAKAAVAAPAAAARPLLRLPSSGLVAGTLVETAEGWQPVESLAIGQRVQTWDGGLRPLQRLEAVRVAPGAGLVALPGGVLSTCSDMLLLPGQHLLVETGAAAEVLDQDVVLVPASALDGYRGAAAVRQRKGVDVIRLGFEAEEIVYANTGAMLHCPAVGAAAPAEAPRSGFFTALDREGARRLLGLGRPGPDGAGAARPGQAVPGGQVARAA
jgi:hypothetical protein